MYDDSKGLMTWSEGLNKILGRENAMNKYQRIICGSITFVSNCGMELV